MDGERYKVRKYTLLTYGGVFEDFFLNLVMNALEETQSSMLIFEFLVVSVE